MFKPTRRARSVRWAVARWSVVAGVRAWNWSMAKVSCRLLEEGSVPGLGGPVDIGGGMEELAPPGGGRQHEEQLELGWQAADVAGEEVEVGLGGGHRQVD